MENGKNGVILAQAGRFGGWSLYLKDGKPTYTYNWLGLKQYTVASPQALPAGKATVRYEFVYDGGGPGKGGVGTISVNGQKVATGRIEQTQCCILLGRRRDGRRRGRRHGGHGRLRGAVQVHGKIEKVTIELKPMTAATATQTEEARKQAALKKGLSN